MITPEMLATLLIYGAECYSAPETRDMLSSAVNMLSEAECADQFTPEQRAFAGAVSRVIEAKCAALDAAQAEPPAQAEGGAPLPPCSDAWRGRFVASLMRSIELLHM